MCGGSVQMEDLVQHVGAPRTQQRTEGQCVERVPEGGWRRGAREVSWSAETRGGADRAGRVLKP